MMPASASSPAPCLPTPGKSCQRRSRRSSARGPRSSGTSTLDPAALTEWAVELLRRLPERPQPRVGIHFGEAVYRDGDYFGGQVNLTHRVVGRALAGEVLVTDRVCEAIAGRENLTMEPIGQVNLKGFPVPTDLFLVRAAA